MTEMRDPSNSHRHAWSKLNQQQLGAYAEYFFKMEFTMAGFQVYSPEVDDRGIDFVVRHETGPFQEVQIKSARIDPLKPSAYVFMQKSKFSLRSDLFLGLALFGEGQEPHLFLIPATRWETPDTVFCDRPYCGAVKSKPEWGVSISRKGMPMLDEFRFALGRTAETANSQAATMWACVLRSLICTGGHNRPLPPPDRSCPPD
ncbi:DUF4365 domain-containing protein [Bosea sp. CS1GBMeth4]|uniref:DUF4365 domain-containing protein n=1 Tax=Bosea sp. CS1GBMeth4 TaxID=1892849 RepID=UPI00164415B4|nr:DUF4365 domain-containing protein [Bosea sp. CS1GBMeth4]